MKLLASMAAIAITLSVFGAVVALATVMAPSLLRLVEQHPGWFLLPAIVVAPLTVFALTKSMLRVRNQKG